MKKNKKILNTRPCPLRPQFGFTLIELLVVIAIIAVLSALIIVNFNAARARARDSQRKSDLREIKTGLMMYHNDFGAFPATGTDNKIKACGADRSSPSDCNWNACWSLGPVGDEMVYMKILPDDSLTPDAYQYEKISDDDFCLWATLENKGDSDIASTQTRCSCGAVTGVGDYYVVCAD